MSNNVQEYNTATIRELLLNAFTAETFRQLFLYSQNDDLRSVLSEFSSDDGLATMVTKALTYCDALLLVPDLLAEVKLANPHQYAHFFGPEPVADVETPPSPEFALSASDRDTIARPISLYLSHVPAGEFLMGSVAARDKDVEDDELPPHTVHVPDFSIGKYPVTNIQYRAFVQANGHRAPLYWTRGTIPKGKQNHPVVEVSWKDALAFCVWLSRETGQSFRLPTEAEWEKAARGADGRIYPWGDEPPDERRCNFDKKVGDTTTIGLYSPQGDSPYGCAGMAGNVWEWCHSLYKPYPYHAGDGREDLQAEGWRVMRGGSWTSPAQYVRCAFRGRILGDFRSLNIGFRIARGPFP